MFSRFFGLIGGLVLGAFTTPFEWIRRNVANNKPGLLPKLKIIGSIVISPIFLVLGPLYSGYRGLRYGFLAGLCGLLYNYLHLRSAKRYYAKDDCDRFNFSLRNPEIDLSWLIEFLNTRGAAVKALGLASRTDPELINAKFMQKFCNLLECPNVSEFNFYVFLFGHAGIDNEALQIIAKKFPNLRELNLDNNNISDQGVEILASMQSLRALDINRNPISKDGKKRLLSSPYLRSLNIDLSNSRGDKDELIDFFCKNNSSLESLSNLSDEKIKITLGKNKLVNERRDLAEAKRVKEAQALSANLCVQTACFEKTMDAQGRPHSLQASSNALMTQILKMADLPVPESSQLQTICSAIVCAKNTILPEDDKLTKFANSICERPQPPLQNSANSSASSSFLGSPKQSMFGFLQRKQQVPQSGLIKEATSLSLTFRSL